MGALVKDICSCLSANILEAIIDIIFYGFIYEKLQESNLFVIVK